MNEKEKLIPQRRFKEFKNTGTWEQRKLGEFADISTGKLDANAMVEDGEYDFYTSGMKKYRIDTPAFEGPAITIAGMGRQWDTCTWLTVNSTHTSGPTFYKIFKLIDIFCIRK